MSRMNGYLSDNSYSRSSSGGYLDGLKDPNWSNIFGGGQAPARGGTGGNFRDYLPRPTPSLAMSGGGGTGFQDTSAMDAISSWQFGGRQQMHDLKMQEIMTPLQAQMKGEWEMFKAKLAASQAESESQRQSQHNGYLNNLGQSRYNTYLRSGI
jgi:hypothetical protein